MKAILQNFAKQLKREEPKPSQKSLDPSEPKDGKGGHDKKSNGPERQDKRD